MVRVAVEVFGVGTDVHAGRDGHGVVRFEDGCDWSKSGSVGNATHHFEELVSLNVKPATTSYHFMTEKRRDMEMDETLLFLNEFESCDHASSHVRNVLHVRLGVHKSRNVSKRARVDDV